MGAAAGLLSMCLFPISGWLTGQPVCTLGTSGIPVSVITAPVAMVLAMIAVPLGHMAAAWINGLNQSEGSVGHPVRLTGIVSPVLFMLSALALVLVRLVH